MILRYKNVFLFCAVASLTLAGIFFARISFVYAHGKVFFIYMYDDRYEPEDITIRQGDKIVFVNKGKNNHWPASNIHPTHRLYPNSGIDKCGIEEEIFDACRGIAPGDSYTFRFVHAGTWRYHDHLYPKLKGKIVVEKVEGFMSEEKAFEEVANEQKSFLGRSSSFFEYIARLLYQGIIALFGKELPAKDVAGRDDTFSNDPEKNTELQEHEEAYDDLIPRNAENIFYDLDALYSYIKKYGPGDATRRLHELQSKYGDCHNIAHEAGRLSYKLWGGEAFQKCSAECQSGCYHGATEAFFRDHGVQDLEENLPLLCPENLNAFFSHQCIHGVGHGLMAWTDYDIHEALRICDTLPHSQTSCYSGVFMENIVGGLAPEFDHYTEYLNDDPHFPCTVVEEKYVDACYFYQTSRMIILFNGNFKKVAEACASIDPKYQRSCFSSMGRDVNAWNRGNIEGAIRECHYSPVGNPRVWCLEGAVQDTFWVADGQNTALAFCKALSNQEEKAACYRTIFDRATQVLASDDDLKAFCMKAEPAYQNQCFGYRIQ